MPKKIILLSEKVIRSSKPSGKPYTLYDGDGLLLGLLAHAL